MLNASQQFKNAVAANSKMLIKATVYFTDGSSRSLTGDDFMDGTTSFTQATSSSNGFDIGAAIIGSMSTTLNNYDGRFDDTDFTGASIAVWLGVDVDGTTEWLKKGHYNIVQPDTYGTTISLDCDDNLGVAWFSDEFSELGYAAGQSLTVQYIVNAICLHCQVSLKSSSFTNSGTYVTMPSDQSFSMIDALGYLAQCTGNYVLCDPDGAIYLDWYDRTLQDESKATLDGGDFAFTNTANTVDGGNFTSYSDGTIYDAGTFDDFGSYIAVLGVSSLSVNLNDALITGVSVTAQDGSTTDADGNEETLDGETSLYGTDDYLLQITDNPFIAYGKASTFASLIGKQVVGLRMRPFEVSAIGDPTAEAGDSILLTDSKGLQYTSYITSTTFKVGAYQTYSNTAESPAANRASNANTETDTWQKAKDLVRKEKSAREQAYEQLMLKIAEARGMFVYKTDENNNLLTDDAEGGIYWMTDQKWSGSNKAPLFLTSDVLWKMAVDTISVSTGFETDAKTKRKWNFILDATGQAILDRVYAIGIDASHLTTGRISAKDNKDNWWDLTTGEFHLGTKTYGSDNELLPTKESVSAAVKATADSIKLSVTNGKLGSSASINLSVNDKVQSSQTVDMTGVRNAFKNDNTAITITAGTVTFNSNTFVVNSSYFKVSSTGVITASSGTIGGFNLTSSSLYYNRTSHTSNTSGVLFSNGGISVGSGNFHAVLSSGRLYGGNTSSVTGYVAFNSYYTSTGVYGLRLAGKGIIAILTPYLGVGNFIESGESTVSIGQSVTKTFCTHVNTPQVGVDVKGITDHLYNLQRTDDRYYEDVEYMTGVSVSVSVNVPYSTLPIAFTKGLMVTS